MMGFRSGLIVIFLWVNLPFLIPQPGSMAASSARDLYGYRMSTASLRSSSWVDAFANGSDIGLGPNITARKLALPFAFKFYEEEFSEITVTSYGYLSFETTGSWVSVARLPEPTWPNRLIAPYSASLLLGQTPGGMGRVFALEGVSASGLRYVVIEWYKVQDQTNPNNWFTFEVILYENGDIRFQYQEMVYRGNWYCPVAGIENSSGMIGINSLAPCARASRRLVSFKRPLPAPRIDILYSEYGRFAPAGGWAEFPLMIRNLGELGTDTYDLSFSTRLTVQLFAGDGVTPLTDSNANGIADTGALEQGKAVQVVVRVQLPPEAGVGKMYTFYLTVRSGLQQTVTRRLTFRVAVPAAFLQAYRDDADGDVHLYRVAPEAQTDILLNDDWPDTAQPVVAVSPLDRHQVTAWNEFACQQPGCSLPSAQIQTMIFAQDGSVLQAETPLVEHSGSPEVVRDLSPVLAVAGDGKIGLAWVRVRTNANNQSNLNLYFAILKANGDLLFGPQNLTENTLYGSINSYDVPRYYSPRLVALGNNRFVVMVHERRFSSAGSLDTLWIGAWDSDGNQRVALTPLTQDTYGWDQVYQAPALASLSGSRVFVAWVEANHIGYMVLDSDLQVLLPVRRIPASLASNVRALQFSNGRVLLGWTALRGSGMARKKMIAYTVLSHTTFARIRGVSYLNPRPAVTGSDFLSLAMDSEDRAILTWSDAVRRQHLYYCLVNSAGTQLTRPMIFLTGSGDTGLEVSSEGYGSSGGW